MLLAKKNCGIFNLRQQVNENVRDDPPAAKYKVLRLLTIFAREKRHASMRRSASQIAITKVSQ